MGVEASVSAVMNSEHLHYSRKAVRLRREERRQRGRERVSSSEIGNERPHLLQGVEQ